MAQVQTRGFQHGLCACFDDCALCVLSYFCPCYIFGKNAEAVGSSCCLCGFCIVMGMHCIVGPIIRGKIRERQGIEGTCCKDWCLWCFCAFCSLVQEAQEVRSFTGKSLAIERE